MRDRLVEKHRQYFATPRFSVAYQRCFKFDWPFSFEDAFIYDDLTQTYEASPLFDRYYNELNSWVLEKSFFNDFPELAEDVPSPISEQAVDISGMPSDFLEPLDFMTPETAEQVLGSLPDVV